MRGFKDSCPYYQFQQCRSCSLMESSHYEADKLTKLRSAVSNANHSETLIDHLLIPGRIFPSRIKAKFSVGGTVREPILGVTNEALEIRELEKCPLHFPLINEITGFIKTLITKFRLPPYSIRTRSGELKALFIVINGDQSQAIVRFVLRSNDALERTREAANLLQARFQQVRVVSVNIQPIPHAILEGPEEVMLSEESVIWESFGEARSAFKLAFGPQSFTQVTYEVARQLYRLAAETLADHGAKSLLDLFCGVGGFSFAAKAHLHWGLGIELSENAISCANLAKSENCADNLRFEAKDTEIFFANYRGPRPAAVLFNPPRRGLSPRIITDAATLAPDLILYSSCNYLTLLRDLGQLATANGAQHYRVSRLYPLDMFPLTEHLEVLAVMERV